jgi:hypothetical protein
MSNRGAASGVHRIGWLSTCDPDRVSLERYAVRHGHCDEFAEDAGTESNPKVALTVDSQAFVQYCSLACRYARLWLLAAA